jgi:uncharacterized protein (TIGR01777 family)
MGNDGGMRIIVAGSTGYIGSALVTSLRSDGHEVVRLVRRATAGPDEVRWNPAAGELDPTVLHGADVAVNLAGVGVGDRRWTDGYKRLILSSRVDSTVTLSRALAHAHPADGPDTLLNASAIGFYGDRGDEVLDESSPPGEGFFPDVCRTWEAATHAAEDAGVRVCHLRTGLVVGPGGGLMKRLVPLFRAGLGGKLGSGRQYQSWISLADEVAAVRFLAGRDDIAGPVNLTAPAAVTNAEFTRALAAAVRRPAVLPVPGFGLRVVLGEFAGNVVDSARVVPGVLTGAGFRYEHPDVSKALQWAVTGAIKEENADR